MTDHKQNPAEIYLVPDIEHGHVWSDDPAPGEGMREEAATRYVREDLVPASNEILARRVVELTGERDAKSAMLEGFRSALEIGCEHSLSCAELKQAILIAGNNQAKAGA